MEQFEKILVKILITSLKLTVVVGLLIPFYYLYVTYSKSIPLSDYLGLVLFIAIFYLLFIGLVFFGKWAFSLKAISSAEQKKFLGIINKRDESWGVTRKQGKWAMRYMLIMAFFALIGIILGVPYLLPNFNEISVETTNETKILILFLLIIANFLIRKIGIFLSKKVYPK